MTPAITTATSCGLACWMARHETCRCSCGGANHGIMLSDDPDAKLVIPIRRRAHPLHRLQARPRMRRQPGTAPAATPWDAHRQAKTICKVYYGVPDHRSTTPSRRTWGPFPDAFAAPCAKAAWKKWPETARLRHPAGAGVDHGRDRTEGRRDRMTDATPEETLLAHACTLAAAADKDGTIMRDGDLVMYRLQANRGFVVMYAPRVQPQRRQVRRGARRASRVPLPPGTPRMTVRYTQTLGRIDSRGRSGKTMMDVVLVAAVMGIDSSEVACLECGRNPMDNPIEASAMVLFDHRGDVRTANRAMCLTCMHARKVTL